MVEDFFAVLLAFPAAALQMDEHMLDMENDKKNDIPMGMTNNSNLTYDNEITAVPEKGGQINQAYEPHYAEVGVVYVPPKKDLHVVTVQVGDNLSTHI